MKACLSLFGMNVARELQYRVAGITNSFVGLFWGFVFVVIYRVFFTYGSGADAGMTLAQTVSYVWLAQVLIAFHPVSVNAEIIETITKGDIGVELCRPLDLYMHWYAKSAAPMAARLVLRGTPIILVACLLPSGYGLQPPVSAAGFVLSVVSVCCAFLLSNSFMMVVTVIRMDVSIGHGVMFVFTLVGDVLSGSYIPLKLWPDVLQPFLLLQPFAGSLDIPLRLYTGTMPPGEALFGICVQLAWTAAFTVLGKFMMNGKLKKLVVQGG